MAARPLVTAHVHGLRDFRRELRKLGREWPRELAATHQSAAELIAEEARRRAPVSSGALRDSIKGTRTQAKAAIAAGTNVRVPYAGVQEFGWEGRGIAAQPYLYPAIAETFDEFLELYQQMIDELTLRAFPFGFPSA